MQDLIDFIKKIAKSLFDSNKNQPIPNQPKSSKPPQIKQLISPTAQVSKQHKLNYFDPEENSNKVWIGIAYEDGVFETQFGRVRDGKIGY